MLKKAVTKPDSITFSRRKLLNVGLKASALAMIPFPLTGCDALHELFWSKTNPQQFVDHFDDGVLDSRYTSLGNASLIEEGGQLKLSMISSGDGVSIFIGDVVPKATCYKFSYDISDFTTGEALVFAVFYEDPVQGEFVAAKYTITQSNSVTVKTEVFDKDGKLITTRTFVIESCDHEGKFSFQLDLVDGKWVFDWGKGVNADDCPVTSLTAEWIQNQLNQLKATKMVITSQSGGLVKFDSIEISEVHS